MIDMDLGGTVALNAGNDFWQRLICGRQNFTRGAWLLAYDAEGVADRSRGSERSFAPRIEERANLHNAS